jgi:hypothetical protein
VNENRLGILPPVDGLIGSRAWSSSCRASVGLNSNGRADVE